MLIVSCAKPGDVYVHNGVTAYKGQKYDQAISNFQKALDMESRYSDAMIFNLMANTYFAMKDSDNGVMYLEKAMAQHPDYKGLISLGMNYQVRNELDKAEEVYLKALEFDDKKGEVYASLGIIWTKRGEAVKALEYLQKAVELSPKNGVIHAHLAVAYALAGDEEKTAEELKIAEKLHCINLGQFEERIQSYKK